MIELKEVGVAFSCPSTAEVNFAAPRRSVVRGPMEEALPELYLRVEASFFLLIIPPLPGKPPSCFTHPSVGLEALRGGAAEGCTRSV